MKIGIMGKMCSGKSTLANTIKIMNPCFNIYSFGKGVKDIAYEYFHMKQKDRSLLVNIATNMKSIDPDVWIKHTMNTIKSEHCIIDDVRHQNELDYLIKHGWYIIYLYVDDITQKQRIKKIYPDTYQDHLQNRQDISERCDTLQYPPNFQPLYIDSREDVKKIHMTIRSFIDKNL
jgi:dephospho-CoA kinase